MPMVVIRPVCASLMPWLEVRKMVRNGRTNAPMVLMTRETKRT
jgi:hypothetical protein